MIRLGFKIICLVSLVVCCEGGYIDKPLPVIAAQPPSLFEGASLTAALSADDSFFTNDMGLPQVSDRGLVLSALELKSDTVATATFTTTAATLTGLHRFELVSALDTAVLKISVLVPPPGPGTVSSDNAHATAGASGAMLKIEGYGTSFDERCSIHVEGAPGFEITSVDVISGALIQLTYNIGMEQPAVQAILVIIDGKQRYELPFVISPAAVFENQAANAPLVKGQAGWVSLSHPYATFGANTFFEINVDGIETGKAEVIDTTQVRIPVRVPFDYPSNTLALVAKTLSQGGAVAETMTLGLSLVEPAYLTLSPTSLLATQPDHQVQLNAVGFDLSTIEELTVEGEAVSIIDWQVLDANTGTCSLGLLQADVDRSFLITAKSSEREVSGVIAVRRLSKAIYSSCERIRIGDHLYCSIVVSGFELAETEVSLETSEAIELKNWQQLDRSRLVAELVVQKSAVPGWELITLNNGANAYEAEIEIVESGL